MAAATITWDVAADLVRRRRRTLPRGEPAAGRRSPSSHQEAWPSSSGGTNHQLSKKKKEWADELGVRRSGPERVESTDGGLPGWGEWT